MNRKKIKIRDLFDLKYVSDPQISPDGNKIAFVLKTVSKDRTKYHSNIYIVDTNNMQLQQYTVGEHLDRSPRWSPDGNLLSFVSDRDEKTQIWLINITGGEARKLSNLDEGSISEVIWSPEGDKLAFVFYPKKKSDPLEYIEDTDKEILEKERNKDRKVFRVISRLRYKIDGGSYIEDERNHIYVLDIKTGKVNQITSGEYDDSNPVFFPDNKRIAFVSNRTENPDLNSFHADLYSVSINISYRITMEFFISEKTIIPVDIGLHDQVY